MSKSNPNQDYFKIRGREPIGQDVEHDLERLDYTRERAEIEKNSGAPPPVPGTRGKKPTEQTSSPDK
jgi:hypothetical protein